MAQFKIKKNFHRSLVREVWGASLGHPRVEIMAKDLQGPVGDRLVTSLVAFVAVGHVLAAYPPFLVVCATFLLPVAARHGGLACQRGWRLVSCLCPGFSAPDSFG